MLGYNKNYATLTLNCALKNSKKMILVLGIERKGRNNNIKIRLEHIKGLL